MYGVWPTKARIKERDETPNITGGVTETSASPSRGPAPIQQAIHARRPGFDCAAFAPSRRADRGGAVGRGASAIAARLKTPSGRGCDNHDLHCLPRGCTIVDEAFVRVTSNVLGRCRARSFSTSRRRGRDLDAVCRNAPVLRTTGQGRVSPEQMPAPRATVADWGDDQAALTSELAGEILRNSTSMGPATSGQRPATTKPVRHHGGEARNATRRGPP